MSVATMGDGGIGGGGVSQDCSEPELPQYWARAGMLRGFAHLRTTVATRRNEVPYFPTISQGGRSSCVVDFRVHFQNVEFDTSYVCHPL